MKHCPSQCYDDSWKQGLLFVFVGKKSETPDGVVAPVNLSVRDDSVDCVAAETALLPTVPDESQSPAAAELMAVGPNESLDIVSENLHTTCSLLLSALPCPFLTSTAAPVLSNASVVSPEPAPNTSYTSESLANPSDNDEEMASDEQLEDWESDVFDP